MLADQLHSGFSLRQAVIFLRTVDASLPASLGELADRLATGGDFITGLAPYLRSDVYFQLRVTTMYGEVEEALRQASVLLQLLATQRRRFRQLLAYPLGLLLGMILLFGTLEWGILPQLRASFAAAPAPTQLTSFGWPMVMISGLSLAIVWGYWWWHLPGLRRAQCCLRVPVVGGIFRAYYAYYLTVNLSQLMQSGLSIQQMMTILRRLPERALLAQLAQKLADQLAQGELPLTWWARQPIIPPQIILLLQKGSTRPQLTRELAAYSQLQYQNLVRRIEKGLAWVQPILLTIVAGLIVSAYLHLLMPLYQNLQGVYR